MQNTNNNLNRNSSMNSNINLNKNSNTNLNINPNFLDKDNFIDYKPNNFNATVGNFVEDVMGRLSGDSIDSIKECMADINNLIEERKILNQKIMKDLEKTDMEISTFLSQMSFGDASPQGREQMLLFKTKAIEIAESRRQEQMGCWQDIAKLKEELRIYKRELNEKTSRMSMLDNILKD